jgi:formate dehydrogenase iron-sulfur subunit
VQTCPTEALEYGDREDLLKLAHERIAAHPGRYIDHVYGEFENGGTSYLILSHIPFNELSLPVLPETPVNAVSEEAVGLTLPVALGWGAALTAVASGVHLYNKNKEAPKSAKTTEAEK